MTESQDDGFRLMKVAATKRISAGMLRLRLTGRDLARFDTFANLHLRLYIAADQAELRQHPTSGAITCRATSGGRFDMRYYTISDIDAQAGWLDIDFVLHERAGPACDFARKARPGDLCVISGPCGRSVKPAARYLLAGDETALPAIARIARSLKPEATGQILIRSENPMPCALATPGSMGIRWFTSDETAFFRAAVEEAISGVRPGIDDHFIWIAGEAADCAAFVPRLDPIRKARRINVPYWRRHAEKELQE